MSIGSKELTVEKLEELDNELLSNELKNAKQELFNLRFQAATGGTDGMGRLKMVKRDIARIYTVLRERELGIRSTPERVEASASSAKTKKASKAEAELPKEDEEASK